MYCSSCGRQLPNGSAYCQYCGAPVGGAPAGGAPFRPAQPQQPVAPQPVVVNVVNNNTNTNMNTNGGYYPYKSRLTALLLCLFLGGIGAHRFYVGKIGTGILWLFTVGIFGIGWVIDLLLLIVCSFRDSAGYPLR